MRAEVVDAVIERILQKSGGKIAMAAGLLVESPKYPLVRVWAKCAPENLDNSPQARIDLRLVVQVETFIEVVDGFTNEKGLYDAVDSVFFALHGHRIPGGGTQRIIVYDTPGLLDFDSDKRAIYQMQASVRVVPDNFSLAI